MADGILSQITQKNSLVQYNKGAIFNKNACYGMNGLTGVTDALKHVTRYTYDQNGNLLTETDAFGNRVTDAYTPEGWQESVTKADGTVLAFAYDRTGSLLIRSGKTGRRRKAATTKPAGSRRSCQHSPQLHRPANLRRI